MASPTGNVTELLADFGRGNKDAAAQLLALVYGELRRLAGGYMRGERPGHTLQPTALVHEVYMRLVDQDRADWKNRAQFFGVAAQLMRRILVDYARNRMAARRGGPQPKVSLDLLELGGVGEQSEMIIAVDEALNRLETFALEQGRIVEMRYFGGLTIEETAEALGVSISSVKREWTMAKAWLKAELSEG
ncbi:MAG: sigma-70 family RNA polymerase sigma factor [bacterium]|nr:sigma-70 family RNA polymerase sigma factor [bacterium]